MLEVLGILFLFLLFGSIFSPLMGGCLSVLMVFTILAFVFIFFSINFIWFLLAGSLLYVFGFVHKFIKWYKLPDINQYMTKYPNARESVGVSCCNCGSKDIIHHGLFHKTSKYRFYTCGSCGSVLYKFKVL